MAPIPPGASCGRRAVVSGLLAALATPIAARAQRRDAARIVLFIDEGDEPYETAFREGLASLGWVEGRTLTIDRRPLAEGKLDPVSGIAAAVLQGRVDAFVVPGDGAARQVRQATPQVPIVVAAGIDLVSYGLANSTARPGGNVTGLHVAHPEMGVRRLALLQEMIPRLTQVGVVFSAPPSRSRATATILAQVEVAARARQIAVQIQTVAAPDKFTPAFGALARAHVGAVLVSSDTFMSMHRGAIAEAALRSRLPTMFDQRAFVEAGGLMSYGPNLADLWRRAASHVDRILKGARAGDLPVESPTRFELVLNGATARALGLTIPASLRKKVDHVVS